MISLSPTPACRNVCLQEAFRRRQALRRAGTNHENLLFHPPLRRGRVRVGVNDETYYPPPLYPLPPGVCVVIRMKGGFRRDRWSNSSALECGRLELWVIGFLRNGILFMGLQF